MFEEYFATSQPLDFDDFANQLLEQGLQGSPSLLHGAVCGVLVAGPEREPDGCLAALSQALELDFRGELAGSSLRLIRVTLQALGDEEFEFHLFLPDDEVEIELRVAALADWCRGFLAGFALSVAKPQVAALGEEVAEILKDVSAIAEADPTDVPEEEEAESNFFELTEYLRFATLNLFMDVELEREEQEL